MPIPPFGENRIIGKSSGRFFVLDCCRLLCALLVVLIHCLENVEAHPVAHMMVTCLAQQAVPFFFIASGFFFANKLKTVENKTEFVIQYVKNLGFLYGAWLILEMPGMIYTYTKIYRNMPAWYIATVIMRRSFLAGQSVYWYLLVLAESSLLAGICILRKKEKALYATAVIGLLLGFVYEADISVSVLGKFNSFIYFVFSWSNNFLMKGLPFVAIGVFFAKNIQKIRASVKAMIAGYLAITLLSIVYFCICRRYHVDWIKYMFLYPAQAVLLFLIGVKANVGQARMEVCRALREISSTIYFIHATVIYYVVDPIWSVNAPILLEFTVAVGLSMVGYLILMKLKFAPLCWLFSMKT